MISPLISASELSGLLGAVTVLDVRWDLAGGPDRQAYLQAHIPGAAFVDLDADLAAPPGAGGRHPLPGADAFAESMRRAGVSAARPVVAYDAASSIAAARAWWLLRYFGHLEVSVLDGGLAAWEAAGLPLDGGLAACETARLPLDGQDLGPTPGHFVAVAGGMPLIDAHGAAAIVAGGLLIDARAPERFRGEVEPIDPVAGHIPGAVNRPTTSNLESSGRFSDPPALREAFTRLGVREGLQVAAYCGSGVTAAHEVLALELAGYRAALYAGSWSEWIADPDRAVTTGA